MRPIIYTLVVAAAVGVFLLRSQQKEAEAKRAVDFAKVGEQTEKLRVSSRALELKSAEELRDQSLQLEKISYSAERGSAARDLAHETKLLRIEQEYRGRVADIEKKYGK